jgi:hypothetical protein
MVAQVAIKEGEQDTAGCRVDDLVDARECERVLRVVPIEIGVVNTHPPFIIVLYRNKYRVS